MSKEKEIAILDTDDFRTTFAKARQRDGAANRTAIAVIAKRIARLAGAVQEEIIGRKDVVTNELVGGAVKFVSSTSQGHVYYCSGAVPFLRIEACRDYFKFLHGV